MGRCWVPSEGTVAGFADGFIGTRYKRGVREDAGVMMTSLKGLLSFRPFQVTAGWGLNLTYFPIQPLA